MSFGGRNTEIQHIPNPPHRPSNVFGIVRTYPSDSSFAVAQVDGFGRDSIHLMTISMGAMLMFCLTDSDSPFLPNVRLVEQAMKTLSQSVSLHLDNESRLERVCAGWHKKWHSQSEQLRMRIESLEAQLAPWMNDPTDGPRLAVVSQHEDGM